LSELEAGAHHYRAYVGPPDRYDVIAALQFNLLTTLGLREHHYLLDIGCGSLRAGRLFIAYLLQGRYFGIEPERWLVDAGIENELGQDILRVKQPTFRHARDFSLGDITTQFDMINAHSIFSHAASSQIRDGFSLVKKALKPGGLFVATYVRGDSSYEGSDWVYPKCVQFREDDMQQLAAEHGLSMRPLDWPHPKQHWLLFFHSGRNAEIDAQLAASWVAWKRPLDVRSPPPPMP
jgi:SAM-dependent methyltransferase